MAALGFLGAEVLRFLVDLGLAEFAASGAGEVSFFPSGALAGAETLGSFAGAFFRVVLGFSTTSAVCAVSFVLGMR